MVSLVSGELPVSNGRSPILFKESWPRFHSLCRLYSTFELHCSLATRSPLGLVFKMIGTFRSDYDYEYEYEFFNVYPVRMPDCERLSRQLAFSYPELRSSWPAPRIESSGKSQFCSPRFADFRSTAQPQGLENVERKWLAKGVLIHFTKL